MRQYMQQRLICFRVGAVEEVGLDKAGAKQLFQHGAGNGDAFHLACGDLAGALAQHAGDGAFQIAHTGLAGFTVTGDIVVTGRVASCDRAENFYRTLCICDAEAGLEVMAGIDHLHNDFPIGSRVTLSLRGLAVAESRGVLQAGRPPAAGSGYATDYIGSRAALGSVLVRSGEALAAPSPAPLAIPALTESRCGTLVRIDGVRYTPEDLSAATWAGYKRFTDADGNAVYTYVRRYARFADAEVPAGTVSLTGILQYDAAGDGRYILKLRDENDCTH